MHPVVECVSMTFEGVVLSLVKAGGKFEPPQRMHRTFFFGPFCPFFSITIQPTDLNRLTNQIGPGPGIFGTGTPEGVANEIGPGPGVYGTGTLKT